jgi:hypothetical protein
VATVLLLAGACLLFERGLIVMKMHAEYADRADAHQGRAANGSVSSAEMLNQEEAARFLHVQHEHWKVGANGASDRGSSDIQCAASAIAPKIFTRGSIASQSTLRIVIARNTATRSSAIFGSSK